MTAESGRTVSNQSVPFGPNELMSVRLKDASKHRAMTWMGAEPA